MATRVKNDSFAKGRRGLATLVKLSETNARIDFEKIEANKGYPEQPAVSYELKVSYGEDGTIPDYIPLKKIKPNGRISLSATMNEDGSKILYAVPASGYFEAKFAQFVTKTEGEAPVMETKQGKKNSYRTFAALLEITGGNWNGLTIKDGVWKGAKYYHALYDNFAENPDGGLAVKGSGSGSDNLADFLDAVVGGGEQIEFSENPLPEIQKVAYEMDTRFNINVAKGWVVSLVMPMSLDEEEISDYVEEIPEALREEDEK